MRRSVHQRTAGRWIGALAWIGVLAGCGDGETRYAITDLRTIEPGPAAPMGATDEQRFGFEDHAGPASHPRPMKDRWQLQTPAGWTLLPPGPFRDHAWRVGDGAECTLSFLEGDAGGLASNVNRWRMQMSAPTIGAAEVAALSKRPWLATEALFLEIDGDYRSAGGSASIAGARLLGLIARVPEGTAFLKLVGPVGVVETERTRLLALADSIRLQEGQAAHGEVADPVAVPTSSPEPAPHSGPLETTPRPRLRFTVPKGWVRQPDQPMREATLAPSEAPDVSIRLTLLRGKAGGLRANIDRWRTELGQPPISDADLRALARVAVLGGEGVYVDIEGGADDDKARGTALSGMILERDDASVFVKMTGPSAAVRGERERFRAFCESLRE